MGRAVDPSDVTYVGHTQSTASRVSQKERSVAGLALGVGSKPALRQLLGPREG